MQKPDINREEKIVLHYLVRKRIKEIGVHNKGLNRTDRRGDRRRREGKMTLQKNRAHNAPVWASSCAVNGSASNQIEKFAPGKRKGTGKVVP